MPDLTAKSFAGLFLLLLTPTGNQIRDDFIEHYNSGAPMSCDQGCQDGIISEQLWGPFPQQRRPRTARHLLAMFHNRPVSNRAAKEAYDSELCVLCNAAMSIVDELLAVNASMDFIIDAISTKICPLVHSFPLNVCHGFCHLYGPYALPVIAQEKAAKEICYLLPICDAGLRQ